MAENGMDDHTSTIKPKKEQEDKDILINELRREVSILEKDNEFIRKQLEINNEEQLFWMEELRRSKKEEKSARVIEVHSCSTEFKTIRKAIDQLQSRLDKIDDNNSVPQEVRQNSRSVTLCNVRLAEVDLRLQMLESASFDGILLWKIRGYTQRKMEAILGKTPSLYSQPFYTSYRGYKMCARVYLNGDGAGKGTHLSLFFVIMKNHYDILLEWPFQKKVKMTLFDQKRNNHITDSFRGDPNSSSFQRPENEMNVATGCPCFAEQEIIERKWNNYICEDAIFIKIEVI